MIYGEDKHSKILGRRPLNHATFSQQPHLSRRRFFEIAGAGVTGSYLLGSANVHAADSRPSVTTQSKAKACIFILMTGAPSHTDTFDLKMVNGITPSKFTPTMINGINWPQGLFPGIGGQLSKVSIVRSMRSWALVHNLAQTWTQIGRSPAAALGDVAPNVGSVVALEKERERTVGQVFPTFLALNSGSAIGPGYLSANYAPFKVIPATTGLTNTTNVDGAGRLDSRLRFLHSIDDPLRVNSPLGKAPQDYDAFYTAARGMMYNPSVTTAFSYSAADSIRYGGSGFGNACLVAKQVLAANGGTRFIQINLGSWDMHNDIYGTLNPAGNNLFTLGKQFDGGVGALLADLESTGLLKDTLVVMVGEFGRTVGMLSATEGRDHFVQQFAAFAGAGIKGGRTIGSTKPDGSDTVDFGWKYNRYFRPEDLQSTVYSALGIDWTKQLDTPFGRTFEYIPGAGDGVYAPMDELWA